MVDPGFEIRNYKNVTKHIFDGVDHKAILDSLNPTQGWKLGLNLILCHLKMSQLH